VRIFNTEGEQLGEHQGLAFYTIGQRKGLGLASSERSTSSIRTTPRNALIVGESLTLEKKNFVASQVHWVSGVIPATPFRAQVKIRYKAQEAPARVTPLENQYVRLL